MPVYAYEAADAQGRTLKGVIEADSPRAARTHLKRQGLVSLSMEAAGNTSESDDPSKPVGQARWSRRSFNATDLAVHTRQMAGLVAAGLPLERALTVLAEEAGDDRKQALLSALRAEVNAGSSFAKALALFPAEFDDTYRAVIAASERSGALAKVLDRLAQELEDSLALRGKLIGAVLYPGIVSLIAVGIVAFLLAYVVPQVAEVLAGHKRALPTLTAATLWLSGQVRSHGIWMIGALIFAIASARLALRHPALEQRAHAISLAAPVFGNLVRGYNASRFATTLSLLTSSGVPMLQAIQAAADTLGNKAMRSDAEKVLALVREGMPLASALAKFKRFPALLVMFTRMGEQTGALPDMLQRASQQMAFEVQRRALRWATLLEPLLIVAMGGIVMLIVLAVLLPIMELNQLPR